MWHISTLWCATKRVAHLNFMMLLERKKKNSFVLVTKIVLLYRSGSSEWCLCASLSFFPHFFTSLPSLFAPEPLGRQLHCRSWIHRCSIVQWVRPYIRLPAPPPPPPPHQRVQIQSLSPIIPQVMSLLLVLINAPTLALWGSSRWQEPSGPNRERPHRPAGASGFIMSGSSTLTG